jgi:hypothetical protein
MKIFGSGDSDHTSRVPSRSSMECDFDKSLLTAHTELETHPIVLHEPLNSRDDLYGVLTEAMRLHSKV